MIPKRNLSDEVMDCTIESHESNTGLQISNSSQFKEGNEVNYKHMHHICREIPYSFS